jgi:hypothetical protein
MKRFPWKGAPAVLLAVAVAGCSSLETSITRPEDQPTSMQLRIEVPQSGSSSNSSAPSPSANVIVEDGDVTLNISAVEIVLDQVEFRRASGEGCLDSDDPEQDDGDSCAELAVQPTVVDLPVASDPLNSQAITVEPGTYEALEFDVVVATAAVNPTLAAAGASVRVRGSFDGQALDGATFAPTGEVQLEVENPIELEQGFSSGMTLTVDVASWFQEQDGTLIDPNVAAQDSALSAEVAQRILASFSIRAGA